MNLLTLIFRLPVLPLQGALRLMQLIQEEVERELDNPATVRRELEEVEREQASGEISDQEAAVLEDEAVAKYAPVRGGTAAATHGDEG